VLPRPTECNQREQARTGWRCTGQTRPLRPQRAERTFADRPREPLALHADSWIQWLNLADGERDQVEVISMLDGFSHPLGIASILARFTTTSSKLDRWREGRALRRSRLTSRSRKTEVRASVCGLPARGLAAEPGQPRSWTPFRDMHQSGWPDPAALVSAE